MIKVPRNVANAWCLAASYAMLAVSSVHPLSVFFCAVVLLACSPDDRCSDVLRGDLVDGESVRVEIADGSSRCERGALLSLVPVPINMIGP